MNSVDFLIQKTNLTSVESNLLQAKYELVYSHKIIDFYRESPSPFKAQTIKQDIKDEKERIYL